MNVPGHVPTLPVNTRSVKSPVLWLACVVAGCTLATTPLSGQQPSQPATRDSIVPRMGSELVIPVGSLILPGLGQYIHGAPATGAAYTAVGIVGLAGSTAGDAWGDSYEDLPRRGRDQFADQAVHATITAGMLSGWDAFQRVVPALQNQGKYDFIVKRESVGDLLSAPFDPSFLRRWTTWVDLAQTALITAVILSERKDGVQYESFRPRDAAYAASLSMNAAVGEEAFFRGYLLPMLYQNSGGRFWLANGTQATLFGVGHVAEGALAGAALTGAWALWEGWVVRRNDWSIRESIFHHFWYDVAIVAAAMIVQEQSVTMRIRFPTITF